MGLACLGLRVFSVLCFLVVVVLDFQGEGFLEFSFFFGFVGLSGLGLCGLRVLREAGLRVLTSAGVGHKLWP